MKRSIFSIWRLIWPPLLYLGMQAFAAFTYMFFYSVAVALKIVFETSFAAGQIYDIDAVEVSETVLSSLNVYIPIIISVVSTVFVLSFVFNKEWSAESFWDHKKLKIPPVLLCFAFGVSLNLFVSGVLTFLPIPDEAQPFDFLLGDNFWLMFLTIALLAPVLEEIIFRGIIQKRLMKMVGIPGAVILQAFMFGVFHLNLLQGVYSFFLGIIIGTVYFFYMSIWLPIVVHISFNGISVIISHISKDAGIDGFVLTAITAVAFVISVWAMIELVRMRPKAAGCGGSGNKDITGTEV